VNVYEQALELDKHRCRVRACGSYFRVEVHHIIPKSQRGPSELWNLITLCSYHHKLVTENKISIIKILTQLFKQPDFRWQPSLNWHLNRVNLRKKYGQPTN